jgi:hypothetical protein
MLPPSDQSAPPAAPPQLLPSKVPAASGQIDEFLRSVLKNPKDRPFLLRIEADLEAFMGDDSYVAGRPVRR